MRLAEASPCVHKLLSLQAYLPMKPPHLQGHRSMHHGNAAWLVLALLAAGASSAVSQPLSPASPVEGPASQLLEPPVSNGLGPEPAAVEPPTFALDFGEAAPEPSASSLGSLPAGSPPPVLKHPPPGRHSPPPPLHRRPPPLRASSPPYGQNFVLPSMISVASPGASLRHISSRQTASATHCCELCEQDVLASAGPCDSSHPVSLQAYYYHLSLSICRLNSIQSHSALQY